MRIPSGFNHQNGFRGVLNGHQTTRQIRSRRPVPAQRASAEFSPPGSGRVYLPEHEKLEPLLQEALGVPKIREHVAEHIKMRRHLFNFSQGFCKLGFSAGFFALALYLAPADPLAFLHPQAGLGTLFPYLAQLAGAVLGILGVLHLGRRVRESLYGFILIRRLGNVLKIDHGEKACHLLMQKMAAGKPEEIQLIRMLRDLYPTRNRIFQDDLIDSQKRENFLSAFDQAALFVLHKVGLTADSERMAMYTPKKLLEDLDQTLGQIIQSGRKEEPMKLYPPTFIRLMKSSGEVEKAIRNRRVVETMVYVPLILATLASAWAGIFLGSFFIGFTLTLTFGLSTLLLAVMKTEDGMLLRYPEDIARDFQNSIEEHWVASSHRKAFRRLMDIWKYGQEDEKALVRELTDNIPLWGRLQRERSSDLTSDRRYIDSMIAAASRLFGEIFQEVRSDSSAAVLLWEVSQARSFLESELNALAKGPRPHLGGSDFLLPA